MTKEGSLARITHRLGKAADKVAKDAGKGAKIVGHALGKEGIKVPELGLSYTKY